jgi:hypothetical protein
MNNAKASVAGGDENHHPNNASRSRPVVFPPPQGHGNYGSAAGQWALWDKDYMKNHGREVIYLTMTNQNNDYLLLSLDEQVVAKTMEQLRGLLLGRYNQVYRTLAYHPGAPQTIAKAMHQHPGSDVIQECGCVILCYLLSGENRIIVNVSGIVMPEEYTWAKPIVDVGCVEAVIFAMKSHPYKVNVQYEGCRFLCALAGKSRPNTNDVNDDDVYRQRIIDAQGLVAVGEARRIHQPTRCPGGSHIG